MTYLCRSPKLDNQKSYPSLHHMLDYIPRLREKNSGSCRNMGPRWRQDIASRRTCLEFDPCSVPVKNGQLLLPRYLIFFLFTVYNVLDTGKEERAELTIHSAALSPETPMTCSVPTRLRNSGRNRPMMRDISVQTKQLVRTTFFVVFSGSAERPILKRLG